MSNPKVFRLQSYYKPDSRETRKLSEFKTSHLKPKGPRHVLRSLYDATELVAFKHKFTQKINLGVELF